MGERSDHWQILSQDRSELCTSLGWGSESSRTNRRTAGARGSDVAMTLGPKVTYSKPRVSQGRFLSADGVLQTAGWRRTEIGWKKRRFSSSRPRDLRDFAIDVAKDKIRTDTNELHALFHQTGVFE